jgi:hypothetical protein
VAQRTERQRTRLCAVCRYSTGTAHEINAVRLFECRRRAPNPGEGKLASTVVHRAAWPIVSGDEWCGEYADN